MAVESTSNWKGIVLAGGKGTRLYPITQVLCKQLLPIYDKPMVYYPISMLMLGGIRDIMVISTPQDLPRFKDLLGDGSRLGVRFSYAEQPAPTGIPEAFTIGRSFIGSSSVCLVLGDNLFYGSMSHMQQALQRKKGATVFSYPVTDPSRYGVVEFDAGGKVISLQEKPARPKGHHAIAGMYCFDNRVVDFARKLKPSARGELEIVDLCRRYLQLGELYVERLGRGFAWLDSGTPENLLEAGTFVATVERRQGMKIACLEEIAFRMGFISRNDLLKLAAELDASSYGQYLRAVAHESTN